MRLFAIILLLGLVQAVSAQAVYKVDLNERIDRSDVIVEGRVVDQRAEWNEDRTLIYTISEIQVLRIFKGSAPSGSIEVATPGGTIGLTAHVVSPSLSLSPGDLGVLFGIPANDMAGKGRLKPFASLQGFIRYDGKTGVASDLFTTYGRFDESVYQLIEKRIGRKAKVIRELKPESSSAAVSRGTSAPVVTTVSPSPITAGTNTVLTITGSGFESYDAGTNSVVIFPDADRGGASFPNVNVSALRRHVLVWTDTEIRVQVPYRAGTGNVGIQSASQQVGTSASPLTVDFNRLEIQHEGRPYVPDLRDKNQSGGYSLAMSTNTSNSGINFARSAAKSPFERALATWQNSTGLNIRNNGGETAGNSIEPSEDPDIVMFDNDARPLESGILGRTFTGFEGCQIGDEIVWWLKGFDMVFRRAGTGAVDWNFGPGGPAFQQFDFESVAVHELGHAHLLGHIVAASKVMHYAIANGSQVRELDPVSDVAGGVHVLENTSNLAMCGLSPMTPLVGVGVEDAELPEGYSIGRPFPNPFERTASIEFRVSEEQHVSAILFDALGRRIDTVFEGIVLPSTTMRLDIDGGHLVAGVYFVRIQGERFSTSTPLTRN